MVSAEETRIFESFREVRPNFAGRELRCHLGADPPDFVGTDADGQRVGIELGEWIDSRQMAVSIARERQKDSFANALKSEDVEPPKNVGMVWIGKAERVALADADRKVFVAEAYKCIADIDSKWGANLEWHEPQGFQLTNFAQYPLLAKYLTSLDFMPRTRYDTIKGMGWITFPGEGGAYTPQNAIDALLALIRKKTSMYEELHKKENLRELYLVAYYDRALIHNTPYFAPNFGCDEVVAIAAGEVQRNHGVFQKVFLFNALVPGQNVTQLYP
jgi:hypothetical protein